MVRLSPALSCNTRPVPAKPETVPPIVYVVGAVVEPQEIRKKGNATIANASNDFVFTLASGPFSVSLNRGTRAPRSIIFWLAVLNLIGSTMEALGCPSHGFTGK